MAARTGLSKQFGLKEETTWGTAVTVDRFYPVVDIEPEGGPEVVYSEAIIADKLTDEFGYVGRGSESYSVQVGGEMYDRSMGVLLKMMMGALGTSGSGPYTHTITQAEPRPSFTAQGAWSDVNGTKRALTWAGCVADSWEINIQAGKRVTWGMSFTAKSEATATAVATYSLASGLVPIHAQNVLGTLFGGAANIIGMKFGGKYETTYDERRYIGSSTIGARQLDQGLRKYTCELTLEFENAFVEYLRYKNYSTGAVVATATVGSNTLTLTFPTGQYTAGPPKATGRGPVQQTIMAEGLSWNSFEPLTIVAVNGDATP
jgi:hypothetical protein